MYTVTEKRILENLLRHNYIGAKHTGEDDAIRCLRKDARGDGKKAIEKLEKRGLVNFHPTRYGVEVSLNPARVVEIRELLEEP
jgi:DNA-binding MarR family transcriptional regulator